jgi:AraC family transcriptional regulator
MKKTIFVWVCIILLSVMVSFAGQEVEIKEIESFWYAGMEFGGPFEQMEKSVQKYFGEFFKQGLTPAGPLLGVFFNDPSLVKPEELKWEVGFPVSKDANVQPPLKMVEFKKTTAAVYLHIGPHENMDKSYEKIFKYVEDNGYKIVWPVYDKYLNNPMQVKPEELKTEMIIPVEKK